MPISKIVLFGDEWGMPALVEAAPLKLVRGIVAAEIRHNSCHRLNQMATYVGVPFLIQPRYQSEHYPAFVEELRHIAPDLIFVNSYSMLLRSDVLKIPCYGAINLHGGLLPEYRGCNPLQWALINNER